MHQGLICSIGRLVVLQASGGLERLIASLARHSERCWVQAEGEGLLPWDKVYGPVLVFGRLWERLGLGGEMAGIRSKTEVGFVLEEAVFAMVLHRLLDPGSERATIAGWRRCMGRGLRAWSFTTQEGRHWGGGPLRWQMGAQHQHQIAPQ